MAPDDLPLNRPAGAPPEEPTPGPSPARWIAVALGGLVAGAVLTFWWMSRAQPGTATPAPTTATDVAVGSNRPTRQSINLPSLDASDGLIGELVSALSRHPTLARLLATKGFVRTMTLAVVQIGDGRTPADPLKALRPSSRLQILGTASGRIDPKSYTRWDGAAAALASIPSADAAQLYVNVKPLFDQAYIELGHPAGDFDSAIIRAIAMLEDTPVLADAPQLLRRSGYFEHEDTTLRGLPPVQKQFVLIGPENRRRVTGWLHQFATNLDLKVE